MSHYTVHFVQLLGDGCISGVAIMPLKPVSVHYVKPQWRVTLINAVTCHITARLER